MKPVITKTLMCSKAAVKQHVLLHSVDMSLMLISAALFLFICKLLV
jgi:hypothetical protein